MSGSEVSYTLFSASTWLKISKINQFNDLVIKDNSIFTGYVGEMACVAHTRVKLTVPLAGHFKPTFQYSLSHPLVDPSHFLPAPNKVQLQHRQSDAVKVHWCVLSN